MALEQQRLVGVMTSDQRNPGGAFWALAAILIFAGAFGGGGSKYGMANLLVILAALVALSFHRHGALAFWRSAPWPLTALVALSVILPAAYLIPLPQNIWSSLPGRDLVAQSYDLIGYAGWSSASVFPLRTLLALTALITPLAILMIGWTAPRDRLILIGWIVVGWGLINFLIGIPQVLSNSEFGVLYPENPMPGVLFGTFANRNTTGLFLVAALSLAALLPAPPRVGRAALMLRVMVCLLLVLAIVLTRSRSALVLMLLPLGIAGLRAVMASGPGGRRLAPLMLGAGLVAIVIGSVTIASPGRFSDTLERFNDLNDARTYIWEDAAYSAQRYWPVGAGTGSFDDVFQIDESLENMTMLRAGRAHNDYLELAIETGAPGFVIAAGWLILLVWLCWRARTSRDRWIAWSGAITLFAIALQSITDYPLRNQTMLAVGAFALLVLARFSSPAGHTQPRGEVTA